jgi:hypothetical protein
MGCFSLLCYLCLGQAHYGLSPTLSLTSSPVKHSAVGYKVAVRVQQLHLFPSCPSGSQLPVKATCLLLPPPSCCRAAGVKGRSQVRTRHKEARRLSSSSAGPRGYKDELIRCISCWWFSILSFSRCCIPYEKVIAAQEYGVLDTLLTRKIVLKLGFYYISII